MSLTTAQIVQLLAQVGWRIVVEPDDFTNEYHLVGPSHDVTGLFQEMIREGWLVSSPNGGSYVLSDAGRAAYMRSTDELGDGKLISPRASQGERNE